MTRLTDHRRFAAATVLVLVALGALLGLALAVAAHVRAIPGLGAGTGVALIDVGLTVRALDRLRDRGPHGVAARALAVATFSRFLTVAVLIGVVLCARSLDPVAVVAGFLLMPVSIGVVGCASLWSETHRHGGRLNGAAR